ncbi:MFS general substrate transporter [Thelephora ganbajun]|uniref:MFS general substrate transporter n=1 Tax=Thelephora ganbajun TaxID=370292 RepID=A0ACB6Z9X8_THEGA|nr:MFS general substrate transporter [Thelephora ganbajun]
MWFTTFVVFLGLMSDTLVYSIIIPIIPFRLQGLRYHHISSRLGWLLFAYSAGLVISTPPLASYSERYKNRQVPLILALVALILSQLFLMFARRFWLMCVARIIQGISSSGVMTAGLALLCDATPKKHIGRQLGIGMAGFSVGLVVGPPVSGALYSKFGYRAPFYFGMAFAGLDLIARLLVIERKHAIPWGIDPAADPDEARAKRQNPGNDSQALLIPGIASQSVGSLNPPTVAGVRTAQSSEIPITQPAPVDDAAQQIITPLDVLLRLVTSPRAVVCIFSTFVYGLVYSGQESVLVLHLAHTYHLDAYKSGLAFIAAVVPTLLSMPLTGYFADNKGAEWVSFLALLLGIPWWGVITLRGSLAQFLTIYAFETLFTSGLVSPLMTELAAVSRTIEGVGYAHVYGSFNLAFGVGSSVGPVLCGQIYDNVRHAWTVISLITVGLLAVCLVLSITFTGDRPLLQRVFGPFFQQKGGLVDVLGMKVLKDVSLSERRGQPEPYPGTPSIPVPQPTYGRV